MNLRKKIVEVLNLNARESVEDIANKIGESAKNVEKEIEKMLSEKYVLGFIPILHPEKANGKKVYSVIEVEVEPERGHGFDKVAERISGFDEVLNVFLVSGGQDLFIEIEGKSVQNIGNFVAEKIAVIPGVRRTSTKFVLKKYKEKGISFTEKEKSSPIPVSP